MTTSIDKHGEPVRRTFCGGRDQYMSVFNKKEKERNSLLGPKKKKLTGLMSLGLPTIKTNSNKEENIDKSQIIARTCSEATLSADSLG